MNCPTCQHPFIETEESIACCEKCGQYFFPTIVKSSEGLDEKIIVDRQ